jgi:tetratricopeptide (TPR) repeat protein
MSRLSFAYFVPLCLLLEHSVAFASDNSAALPIGSQVLAKRPGVNLRIKNKDAGPLRAGVIERVQKVERDWLWIGRGWVQRADVVPLWQAVEFFTAEIGKKPTPFAYVGRASAASKRSAAASEVHADLDKALALDEDFAPAHRMRGVQFVNQKEFDRALEAFDDAIRADREFAEAYADRGAAFFDGFAALNRASPQTATKDAMRALKDLERATQLCPRLASPYARWSSILMLAGEREKALAKAQEAIKHDPAEWRAHLTLGQYWETKGDDERAMAAYTEAIRAHGKCGEARLRRGKIYSQTGDYQKAVVDLNQAVQIMPRNVEALEAREFVYYRLGSIEKSRADRVAVARLRQDYSKTTTTAGSSTDFKVGAAIEKLGSPAPTETPPGSEATTSMETFDKISYQPSAQDSGRAAIERLNLSARRQATSTDERYRNGARAVELATEACEKTEWKRPDMLDTLAAAYAETGDFEAAVQWQSKAIELATDARLKADAQERLALYRDHKPCREEVLGRIARAKQNEAESR